MRLKFVHRIDKYFIFVESIKVIMECKNEIRNKKSAVRKISKKTLQMIESSMKNYNAGRVSKPINLDEIKFDNEE